jgi:acyl carrier protein
MGVWMATTREQIRQFIRDSFLADEFTDEESFLGSGLIDSLGILQLVSFVESQFGLAVPDTDLVPAHFDSVVKLASYVDRRNRDKAAA